MKSLKSVELRPGDVSGAAFKEYSGNDCRFWIDSNGAYYVGESSETAELVGSLEDVQDYLLSFIEPDIPDNVMDAIAVLMNDDIREKVHGELAPCTNIGFLARYCELAPDFADVLNSEFSIDISTYQN